jgi:LmbE family N-acetylglucosaminyl deacetylase
MPDKEFTRISFYIVAHADDWQLFMQPNIYNDLTAGRSRVVFIITTAGDAGMNSTYWSAREEGMKSSLRFCVAPLMSIHEASGTSEFNGHAISYFSINNATCYFLRLPDGNLDGSGFSAQQYQSLSKFRGNEIPHMTAIDNSAIYHDWQDFQATLQTIIKSESHGTFNILLNYLNPDTHKNPGDHSDHIATGQAVQDMAIASSLRQGLFVGYGVGDSSHPLQPTELFWKSGMFAAYEKAVFDACGSSTLHESVDTYLKWCLCGADFTIINP